MNLLPRAEILCPLSVLERVRIIEVFLRGNVRILSVQRKLSTLERCPYREVRVCYMAFSLWAWALDQLITTYGQRIAFKKHFILISCDFEPAIRSFDTSQRMPLMDVHYQVKQKGHLCSNAQSLQNIMHGHYKKAANQSARTMVAIW